MTLSCEKTLNYLDQIPDRLYRKIITHSYRKKQTNNSLSHSSDTCLQQRCIAILKLRSCLLQEAGYLDENDLTEWLDSDIAIDLLRKLNSSTVRKQSQNNETYVDGLILKLLEWLSNKQEVCEELDDSDLSYSSDNSSDKEKEPATKEKSNLEQQHLNPDTVNEGVSGSFVDSFSSDSMVTENEEIYKSMQALNKGFAVERQLGWDLSVGVKNISDVKLLLETYNRVKKLPYLQSIIKLIGRQQKKYSTTKPLEGLNFNDSVGVTNNRHLPDDYSVNSITGVTLGDDISRILPSELSMLAHPKLKLLWHAKRADRLLHNYHIQGVLSQHVPNIDKESVTPDSGPTSFKQQGPMVICLDTSASMKGGAEYQAKAIVFETMRVARIEQRDCILMNFSSTNQILDMKLDLHDTGWQPIIDFLKHSFHGGTDIDALLNMALAKVQEKSWNSADLLLVSDGRFNIDKSVIDKMNMLEQKPAIYGIQVSHWNHSGFNKICHQTFSIPYDR